MNFVPHGKCTECQL